MWNVPWNCWYICLQNYHDMIFIKHLILVTVEHNIHKIITWNYTKKNWYTWRFGNCYQNCYAVLNKKYMTPVTICWKCPFYVILHCTSLLLWQNVIFHPPELILTWPWVSAPFVAVNVHLIYCPQACGNMYVRILGLEEQAKPGIIPLRWVIIPHMEKKI